MGFVDDIQSKKYIVIETYKRDRQPVQTPVWFYIKDERIQIITRSKTGKVKRIRNNPRVKIAECTIKGKITGPWASGTADTLDDTQIPEAVRLRHAKYGIVSRLAKFLTSGKGNLAVYSIKLDDERSGGNPSV